MLRWLCGSLLVLFTCSLSAQSWGKKRSALADGDNYHFGYISGSVGYSMLQTGVTDAMPQGNVGGAIGVGYEFRNSGLWVNMGLQMSFHRSSLAIDAYTRDFNGLDTQGLEAVMHYRVSQTDAIQWNYVDVPLMIGYYIHGFHVGAGLKVSYAIQPVTITKGVYTLSATNTSLNVTFENMPDRGYTDYKYEQRQANHLNAGVSLIGEAGYDLLSSVPTRSRICHILKIAFYFEYGLNTQLRKWDTPQVPVEPQPNDMTQAAIHPYLNTFASPARTVPFFTGVKLTYMIGGSRTARAGSHHGCMCYQ